MKLNIRGEKVEITPAIKEYIETKMERLNRYFEDSESQEAFIKVRIRGAEQIIEVTVPTHKFTLRAEESHKDLYAATDLVIDKLERQIRKNKTRLNNRYKNAEVVDFDFNFEVKEKENEEKIVKRKTIESKPMDEEEAILQMELINHDFFAFKNVKEECISVVYKRKDGHYGLINMK